MSNPFHLIFGFELLCNTLLFSHLIYKLKKHTFSLLVDFSEVGLQLSTKKQGSIERFSMLSQILLSPLAPYADSDILKWYEVWNEVITLLMIGSTHSLK